MRLIDADTLQIAIIEKGQANERGKYIVGDIWELTGAEIGEVINSQPTIQPEPHWTPVTERLPKEDGSYLVSGKWGSGKESVGDCEFSVEDGYFQTAWNFDVLAWIPLPEPFKGVTE